MTYFEFRDKYNGQYIDWDGAYGPQCWDLAQKYFTECLGVPSWVLSGCGLVSNMLYPPKRNDLDVYFDEVDTHAMMAGDVCIWTVGHIAIFDNWDGYNCYYFSQNPNPSQVMQCNLGGEMHAFRLKGSTPPTPPTPPTPSSFNIGDKVIVNGQLYGTADGENPGAIVSGVVTEITRKADGHPYPYNTTGDLGWVAESSLTHTNNPQPTPPAPQPTGLQVGDRVKIIGTGNGSSFGDSNTAYGIGWERQILRVWEGRPFPYQVGNNTGTTGFYKADALEKI